MKKLRILLPSCLLVIFLSSCASIVSGRNQTVSVATINMDNSSATQANCKLTNAKGEWYVSSTPASVLIRKGYGDLSIDCSDNNKSFKGSKTFKSEHEGIVWGNILLGGLIGWAIDAGTGSGFSYPQTMNVEMAKNIALDKK